MDESEKERYGENYLKKTIDVISHLSGRISQNRGVF